MLFDYSPLYCLRWLAVVNVYRITLQEYRTAPASPMFRTPLDGPAMTTKLIAGKLSKIKPLRLGPKSCNFLNKIRKLLEGSQSCRRDCMRT